MSTSSSALTTLERVVLLVAGLPLALGGLGLTASFGILAPIGIPLLIVGLGCISAAIATDYR